ncbi:MAG: response regulator [Cellvibrionaceae bacterium]
MWIVEPFSPYKRVLLVKISFLWGPVLAASVYVSIVKEFKLDILMTTLMIFTVYLSLINHSRLSSAKFWRTREAEYLNRIKYESYQAFNNSPKNNAKLDPEFIAAYSQELKIHLDSLLSGVHLLKDTPVSLQQKELLDTTVQAGDRTINLIDTVGDFSRSNNVVQSELSIFPVMRELESIFINIAKEGYECGIDTCYLFDQHLPQRIKGDKKLLTQTLSLLLNCMTRLNVSGKTLITVNFEAIHSVNGHLKIRMTDLVDEDYLNDNHPLIEKLVSSRQLNGSVSLNYLMAKNFAKRHDAKITVSEGGEHEHGVGIEIVFPVEAKSGSVSEFYANTNLNQKSLAVVNCPEKIKDSLVCDFRDWGLNAICFESDAFAECDNSDNCNDDVIDAQSVDSESVNNSINEVLKTNSVDAILWFGDISDVDLFNGQKSVVKQAIFQHDHLSSRPVFVVATERQIQSSLNRQFMHEQPNIHALQRPLQLHQFHDLLVDALFNVDFHAHHVLNKLFSLDDGIEGERILLVEDHRVNQMVAEGMLKRLGYTAKIANNGAEALEMLEEQDFDLILMDCQMAEMDGFTATEAIRFKEKSTDKHIPIIALTANTTEEDQNKCLAVGMDDYLSKPVRYTDLEHSLKRWLDDGSRPSIHH